MVSRVLTEEVTFEKRFQGSKGVNPINSRWKNILGRRESQCKSPRVGAF